MTLESQMPVVGVEEADRGRARGRVSSVRGSVVDITFQCPLPTPHSILTMRGPLTVPVGPQLPGKTFDVFGRPIDHLPDVEAVARRVAPAPPAPMNRRVSTSEFFAIEAITASPVRAAPRGEPQPGPPPTT